MKKILSALVAIAMFPGAAQGCVTVNDWMERSILKMDGAVQFQYEGFAAGGEIVTKYNEVMDLSEMPEQERRSIARVHLVVVGSPTYPIPAYLAVSSDSNNCFLAWAEIRPFGSFMQDIILTMKKDRDVSDPNLEM